MIKPWLALAVWILISAGCQAVPPDIPAIAPEPTSQIVPVLLSPEVAPARSALRTCSDTLPEISLRLIEIAPGQKQVLSGDILIHLGFSPAPDMFHVPLAQESFAIIAHPDYPLNSILLEDLQAGYRGEIHTWADLGVQRPFPEAPPVFWTYPPSHPLVNSIFRSVLGIPPNLPPALNLAPDSKAMQQAVLDTEGAVGYIPMAWLTPELKRIRIKDESNLFPNFPVLATTWETPSSAAKLLLSCLQGLTGQEALHEFYAPWEDS
jgi:DNA-binding transcriptional LysR family regulator